MAVANVNKAKAAAAARAAAKSGSGASKAGNSAAALLALCVGAVAVAAGLVGGPDALSQGVTQHVQMSAQQRKLQQRQEQQQPMATGGAARLPGVESLILDVQRDERLRTVDMDLPSIVGVAPEWAEEVNTSTFMDFVNSSKYALVSFFDPRSESYLVTRRDLDRAARLVSEDPELRDSAALGFVNVAVDSYLQTQYSAETTASWQEGRSSVPESINGTTAHAPGFLFGKKNFFPIITKLFHEGKEVSEYRGAVRARSIAQFLRQYVAPNMTELATLEDAEAFLSTHTPAAIGCFEGEMKDAHLAVPAPQLGAEMAVFQNFTEQMHGFIIYARASDPSVCAALDPAFQPGTVLVRGSPSSGAVFADRIEPSKQQNTEAHVEYALSLTRHMLRNKDPLFVEMTPDNSWSLIEAHDYIMILLVDFADKATQARAMGLVERAAANPDFSNKIYNIKFTFASGRNFASQFGLSLDNLPNLAIYYSRQEKFGVYHSPTADDTAETVPFAGSADEDVVDGLTKWFYKVLPAKLRQHKQAMDAMKKEKAELEAHRESISEDATASPETTAMENTEAAQAAPLEQEAEQPATDTTEEPAAAAPVAQEEREAQTGTAEEEEGGEEEDDDEVKEDDGARGGTWRDSKFWDPRVIVERTNMKVIWGGLMALYKEFLTLEEAYQNFPAERQARAENRLLRKYLDGVYARLDSRPHLRLMVDTVPKTPTHLEELSVSNETQHEFWVKLQQMSGFARGLVEDTRNSSSPEVKATKYSFAEDYAWLFNERIQLGTERNDVFLERFKAEHGRAPTNDDIREVEIERRSVKDLSMTEFINDYAKKRKPVIITDLHMFKQPWTREHISEKCGHYSPEYKVKAKNTHNWGGLVSVNERVNLTEFLDTHTTNETRKNWYLHDWGLPRQCPEIMGPPPYDEFIYPRYFAGDYFQRMPFVGYQHSWPSLFVGANGTESKMHIDSGGTNFWMYLIEGEKEWRFFDRFDDIELYAEPLSAHYFYDVFRPDAESMPLIVNAPTYKGTQRPGELIFIPGGCPHGVRNHDDIIGISMNYLDVSNEWLYLWMQVLEEDFRDYELYANPSFPRGLKSDQKDLTLGQFKSQEWYSMRDELDLF